MTHDSEHTSFNLVSKFKIKSSRYCTTKSLISDFCFDLLYLFGQTCFEKAKFLSFINPLVAKYDSWINYTVLCSQSPPFNHKLQNHPAHHSTEFANDYEHQIKSQNTHRFFLCIQFWNGALQIIKKLKNGDRSLIAGPPFFTAANKDCYPHIYTNFKYIQTPDVWACNCKQDSQIWR